MTRFALICKPLLTMLLSTALCSASVCQHRNDCSGNGECMLGVCQCDIGYTGTRCEKGLCLQRDPETCDHVLVAAACRSLSFTGIVAPLSCLQQTAAPPGGCNTIMSSCQEIFRSCRSAPSGNYQLQLANGSLVEVYCDMEGSNCGGQGGWTRVAFINMTEPGAICPHGLTQRNISGRILCTRIQSQCQGTIFSTLGLNYNQVCGRVIGYQQGGPEAFQSAGFNTIDSAYINGVSITHGSPRQHIWSFAAGPRINELSSYGCPCNEGSYASPPSYVGSNYYCESGTAMVDFSDRSKLYASDPLWDGQQCTGLEGPCCANPSMPWFNTTLPNTSTDDIELRLCFNEGVGWEDSPLELMELYIR